MTQLQSESANSWNNLGVALCRNGQFQEAVEALEKADSMLQGGDRAHRMFLAMALWELGTKDEARKKYVQGAAWLEVFRANSSEQQRFRQEAEEVMGLLADDRAKLIEDYYTNSFPENGSADDWFARGRWQQQRGSHDEAISSYTAALELEPENRAYLKSLARTHIAAKQWERAIACYDELITLDPRAIHHFRSRAQCELVSQGLEVYRERCREALERFDTPKSSIEDKRWVAAICSLVADAVDDTGAIVQLARQIEAANPPNAGWSKAILAKALLNDGQTDEALTMFREVESNSNIRINKGLHCFNLAIAYHISGEPDIAEEWLEKGDRWLADHLAKGEFNNGRFPLNILIGQWEAHERLGVPLSKTDQTTGPKTDTADESNETN